MDFHHYVIIGPTYSTENVEKKAQQDSLFLFDCL